MAVKACTTVTLFHNVDIIGTTYYYKLISNLTTPNVPDDSVVDPTTSAGGSWSTSEPSYTAGSTSYLYYTIQTRFSDGTQSYSYANIVSGNRKACLSSSYEAAKAAYNQAIATQTDLTNLTVGGRNYVSNLVGNWVNGNWNIPSAGSPCSIVSYNGRISLVNQIKVEPNAVYWIKLYKQNSEVDLSGVSVLFRQIDIDGNYLGRSSIGMKNQKWTCPSDCHYVALTLYENCQLSYIENKIIQVKLERSDKPTDWTYSPEDIDTLINGVNTTATGASNKINAFLNGDETTLTAVYQKVEETIDTEIQHQIIDEFTTLVGNQQMVQNGNLAYGDVQLLKSVIRRSVDSRGNPYIELGVEPTADVPETYRLRISNNEIYMVYGSGDSENLTKLTNWYTKDGKSALEVNSLLTQQEMAIQPFSYIKNDDGSLSFRKVE